MHPGIFLAEAAQASGGGLQMLAVYGLLFAGMWFLLIAPQRKKQRNQLRMIDALRAGDRVVTTSGIIGTVAAVKGTKFVLKVADNTKIEIFRSYIQMKLDKPDGESDKE